MWSNDVCAIEIITSGDAHAKVVESLLSEDSA